MRIKHAAALAATALALVPSTAAAADAGCAPIDLDQSTSLAAQCQDLPTFKASFLNRLWKFNGEVNEYDSTTHSMDMTTSEIADLPARFRSQDDDLLDQETHVTYGPSTRVYGPDGKRVSEEYLEYASTVSVRGRLLSPRRWFYNEDGDAIPTVRGKRIKITEYGDPASDQQPAEQQDETPAPAVEQPKPVEQAADPTPADHVITSHDVSIWIFIGVGFDDED